MLLVLKQMAAHTKAMQPVSYVWSRPHRRYVALIIVTVALVILLPQIPMLAQSWQLLRAVSVSAIVGSLICLGLTFPLAASTYHYLARRRLVYRRTLLVALANMFTNRLLPAGTGSIATFFVYLRKRKHTVSQATSVVAVNNFLGLVSHSVLLLGLLSVDPAGFGGFTVPRLQPSLVAVIVVGLAVSAIVIVRNKAWHRRPQTFISSLRRDLSFYGRFPLRLTGAFVTSTLLTVMNALALWYCVQAVHGSLSVLAALIVFTIGMIAGTATPTPGGLGGTEAGLLAALIGYHVPSQTALAAVVLYRLLSYWLTLGLGAITYIYVERRGYLHRFEPI